MQMEKAPSLRRKALHVGAALGLTTAAAVVGAASPGWAAVSEDTATVSPASGKIGGGNSISVNVASGTPALAFVQGTTRVVFDNTPAGCPDTYPTPAAGTLVAPGDLRVVSTTKLAVTVPAGVGNATAGPTTAGFGTGTAHWNVCAYSGTGADTLQAAANDAYIVGAVPVVSAVTPSAGPAQGGGTLVITGTDLDNSVITLGGVTLSTTGTSTRQTVTIPARVAGGPYSLVVARTGGGTTIFPNAFTYTNGVTVSPNTSPNTKARTDISVTGVGFSSANFTTTTGATPNDNNAHVYLVRGAYDPSRSGQGKANGPVTECLNVLAITDTELVCSLYLSGGGVPQGSQRTITGTLSGTTLVSTTATFGPADVGMAITGPASLGTGIYITSVTDPTRAVVNKAPTTALTTAGTITLTPGRTYTGGAMSSTGAALTAANASFTSADVGRAISGAGIPADTVISSVSGGVATLSNNPVNASLDPATNYTIGTSPMNAVPNGTYTVTVVTNGGVDVQAGGTNANANYNRSIISSGSTFTVADY